MSIWAWDPKRSFSFIFSSREKKNVSMYRRPLFCDEMYPIEVGKIREFYSTRQRQAVVCIMGATEKKSGASHRQGEILFIQRPTHYHLE